MLRFARYWKARVAMNQTIGSWRRDALAQQAETLRWLEGINDHHDILIALFGGRVAWSDAAAVRYNTRKELS